MSFTAARKNLRVTTYSKVVFVLLVVSFGFILLFAALFYFNQKQEKEFYQTSSLGLEREINGLIDLNSDSYISLINEITYWDDLVDFVHTKDIEWFDNSVVYLIDSYKVDYIDVYTMQEEFVSKASTTKINSKDFIPKEVFPKLKNEKLIKFYAKIPEGIVAVYGATIHSSIDPFKNKTAPQGYFFIAKLLDKKYFLNIQNVSSAKAEFYDSQKKIEAKTIYYIKDLKDINGNKIASLFFQREAKVDFSNTRKILYIMLIAFCLSILIFFYYAKKWAQRPIRLIKEVLEKGNVSAIDSLKRIRGEFRYIGKLFEQNFNQKIQLEKTKKKAEESDKLKSAFLMNLSHEIRTPMNAIMGFSDLLLKKDLKEDEKEEYLKIIQKSGKNLIDIIDDLVEMSKIDSDLIEPKYSSIDLKNMIQATFESIKITVPSYKNIDFKLIVPKDTSTQNVVTDVVKLNQVITNLLTNAIKFTDEGFIVLDYEFDFKKNQIHFTVKDSGKGIPDELQETIFSRFNKVDFISDQDNKGLGLGLAISKAYIEMLGGTISLKSEVGVGSTFSFSIPLQFDSETTLEAQPIYEDISLGDEEIILVAEDDNINYLLIEKLLKLLNFKVVRAKNGQEAVEICKQNKEVDLILMDIKMPSVDGHEAFTKIREFNKDIPIVAQTSYSFPEEIEKINKTGFNDFISKPIDKDKLYIIIRKYIQNK
ncbi:ATP-binding protein [Flavobacterium sp. NRK F7]|uniref:ATP-binding protein n=1 Tax=Flavobacterium sp. NRK F7 TaxID=2954930 RepID=UPI002091661A|nr:ATP-binding protein [Flavobacterium sp. NRK F7]MCO6162797.1 response regulator [Flavobacterium sp. NRK F7]